MPLQIRRKLYTRGSSFETTIPMPLLFKIDRIKKYNVIFHYDQQQERWYVDFEEQKGGEGGTKGKKGGKK